MKFRELHDDDMPLLLEWLQREHIKEWWNDGDDTLEKVRSHYTSNPDTTKRFFLLDAANKPIGYFQYYIEGSAIGIDQFIADEFNLGKGMGTKALLLFISMIRKKHSPMKIFTDPSPKNIRAIRFYEKAEFKRTAGASDSGDEVVCCMELF